MKGKRILDALGKVDDAYVEEAESGEVPRNAGGRHYVWLQIGALAACLCLVFGGIFALRSPGDPAGTTVAETTVPVDTTVPDTVPTEPELEGEALSQEDLDRYQILFSQQWDSYATHPTNWYNFLLLGTFDSPENVNIVELFYNGVGDDSPLTEEEETFLEAQGAPMDLDFTRMEVEAMNEVLEEYFGLTLEETNKVGMESVYYNAETDSYYHSHSDYAEVATFTITAGEQLDDGTIRLYYYLPYEAYLRAVTLESRMYDGQTGYYIRSNVVTEYSAPEKQEWKTNGSAQAPITRTVDENVELPEYEGTPIGKGMLDWYQVLFSLRWDRYADHGDGYPSHGANWYNAALCVEFDDPTDLDLELLFYMGLDGEPAVTDEERAYAVSQGLPEYVSIDRLPVERMDEVLTQYFGVTFADIGVWKENNVGGGVCYNENTGCYYHAHSDTRFAEGFNIQAGEVLEEDTVRLYYTMSGDLYAITMRSNRSEDRDGYTILSNKKVEQEKTVYTTVHGTGERMGYTTETGFLVGDDCVFFIEEDVLYKVKDGVKTVAYDASAVSEYTEMTTNGETVIFADEEGMVIALDAETCEATELFNAKSDVRYITIVGATDTTILICRYVDDFDYNIDVFDWSGEIVGSYGYLVGDMENGYLILYSGRSDVGFRTLTVYSPAGELLIEKEVMWDYEYVADAVYFVRVVGIDLDAYDEITTPPHTLELCRVDTQGMSTVTEIMEAGDFQMVWLMCGYVQYTDPKTSVTHYLTLTGDRIDAESEFGQALQNMRFDLQPMVETPEQLYYTVDGDLYLQNEDGDFYCAVTLTEGGDYGPYIYAITDGYVYISNGGVQWVKLP